MTHNVHSVSALGDTKVHRIANHRGYIPSTGQVTVQILQDNVHWRSASSGFVLVGEGFNILHDKQTQAASSRLMGDNVDDSPENRGALVIERLSSAKLGPWWAGWSSNNDTYGILEIDLYQWQGHHQQKCPGESANNLNAQLEANVPTHHQCPSGQPTVKSQPAAAWTMQYKQSQYRRRVQAIAAFQKSLELQSSIAATANPVPIMPPRGQRTLPTKDIPLIPNDLWTGARMCMCMCVYAYAIVYAYVYAYAYE